MIVVPFPFTDLSGSKRRPAFVITNLPDDDIILCQITSKNFHDRYAVSCDNDDFANGSLPVESFIRPNKIFTADKKLILSVAGHLSENKIKEVIDSIGSIIFA